MTIQGIDLAREYAMHGCEEAFAALMLQHVNLVYSVVVRRLGDREEVSRDVFIILARKAVQFPRLNLFGPRALHCVFGCRRELNQNNSFINKLIGRPRPIFGEV